MNRLRCEGIQEASLKLRGKKIGKEMAAGIHELRRNQKRTSQEELGRYAHKRKQE